MHCARIAAVLLATAVAPAVSAHHGIANFDLNRDLEVSGTITAVRFVNPHAWLHFEADDGNEWRCEMRSASVLRRSGWSAEMFGTGMRVTVTGAPDRRHPHTCYLATVELPDGRSMDRYGQLREPSPATGPVDRPARMPGGEPNIAGDWAGEQRVMTDPRGLSGALVPRSVAETVAPGEVPAGMRAFPGARGTPESLAPDPVRAAWERPSPVPLTDAGRRAADDFDPSSPDDNPRLRCEPTNILFDWMFDTPVHRITQHADRLTFEYGTVGGLERVVHLDRDAPPEDLEPSLAGFSIGRWEDDVLVVETAGFAPGVLSADGYLLHSDRLQVEERFWLDTDTMALHRRWEAVDPLRFEGVYAGADTVYPADVPFAPDRCEEPGHADAPPADTAAGDSDAPWWQFWRRGGR